MSGTPAGLSALQAISCGTALNAIGAGQVGITGALSNVNLGSSTDAWPSEADLWLVISSFAPTAAGNLQAVVTPSDDGSNYEPIFLPAGSTQLQPFTSDLFSQFPVPANTYAANDIIRISLAWHSAPKFKIGLFNNTGVALALTSASIYVRGSISG